jgi:hypothetical protein
MIVTPYYSDCYTILQLASRQRLCRGCTLLAGDADLFAVVIEVLELLDHAVRVLSIRIVLCLNLIASAPHSIICMHSSTLSLRPMCNSSPILTCATYAFH